MSEHMHGTSGKYTVNKNSLTLALSITTLMMIVEFGGGILSHSLALISDATHMLTDAGALALALFALRFSQRPASVEKTYGFYRSEILAALLNGSILVIIACYIFYKAIQRFANPAEVKGVLMLSIASIGLLANLAGAFVLSKGSRENLNVRAALWHIISDALSSVGVILGGLIILFADFYLVDPIISLIIGIVILRGAWRLVKESVDILLEATPRDIKFEEVVKEAVKIEGVREIHDLHIWTIASGIRALSAHVLIDDTLLSKCGDISKEIKEVLKEKFSVAHATLEFECETCLGGVVCKIEKQI